MLPLGPPDRTARRTRRASAFAAWPGLLAEPARAGVAARSSTSASAKAYWIEDWARFAGARRGRRPGALRPRVGRAARLRRRARRAADRRRADLRRPGRRRPPRPPRAVPRRRGRGHAARRLHRQGPAVGQPALRLAGAAAPRLPLVGRAAAAHVRAVRPRADRPLPRLRRLLGGARGRGTRWRALAARAGARGVRRRGARARRAAADRRGPRRHHPGGRAAARRRSACPAWSCCSSASTPDDPRNRTTPQPPPSAVVYTGTHDNDTVRGWYESLPASGARRSTRDAAAGVASASRGGR